MYECTSIRHQPNKIKNQHTSTMVHILYIKALSRAFLEEYISSAETMTKKLPTIGILYVFLCIEIYIGKIALTKMMKILTKKKLIETKMNRWDSCCPVLIFLCCVFSVLLSVFLLFFGYIFYNFLFLLNKKRKQIMYVTKRVLNIKMECRMLKIQC